MKTGFDALPHLETYFRDLGNPDPDVLEVLKSIDTIRVALDSPADWSADLFLLSALDPFQSDFDRRQVEERASEITAACSRCLREALWLRDHLPTHWEGKFQRGGRRFVEKNLAIPELKRLQRALEARPLDESRVRRALEKLALANALSGSDDPETGFIAPDPVHQPTLLLRHWIAQRLLVERFTEIGLDRTLQMLHEKWLRLRAERAKPDGADGELLADMRRLIGHFFEKQGPTDLTADGPRRWSVTGELGEVLGWLSEKADGRYELIDEWGLPVAYHVRRQRNNELVDIFGLSVSE